MKLQRPNINIRFATKAQVQRLKRAARIKGWSLNDFVIRSADEKAEEVLKEAEPVSISAPAPSLPAEHSA